MTTRHDKCWACAEAEAAGDSAAGLSARRERAEREALAISSSQDSGQVRACAIGELVQSGARVGQGNQG